MAKYFDKREGREKSLPDCSKHGLVWNSTTQRCEQHTGPGYVDEYAFLNGGGYYGNGNGYVDGPVYEPVYVEPESVYYALPPPPVIPAPAPVYQPPVYQPAPEPFYYEPPAPVLAPTPVYVEPEPIIEEFFALPYVEPIPEPEPEEIFFRLPVGPEPEPTPAPIYSDWAFCSNEYQRCNFTGTREVRYGKGSTWTAPRQFTDGVDCSNAVFGDPLYGTVKECQTRVVPGLVQSAIPEAVTVAEDFYLDDYGGGGFYNGGGGGDFYGSGAGDDFYYGYGFDPVADQAIGGNEFFYDPSTGDVFGDTGTSFLVPDIDPVADSFIGDPYLDWLDYYSTQGYGGEELLNLASQGEVLSYATGISAPLISETYTPFVPPVLPDISPLPIFPFTPFDPVADQSFEFFRLPYIEEPPPPPPAPPLPCAGRTPDGHIPSCPSGYGRGPFGSDPCLCYPLPPPPTTQQPRPPTAPPPAPRPPSQQAPRPQQQQPCPATHCKHPTTGQCIPTPRGYARHPQTQVCTALTAQASPIPIPSEARDLFENLKELPWWVWLAAGGLLLLSQGGGGGRQTTITHRRA